MADPTDNNDARRAAELALKKCGDSLSNSEAEELCQLLSRSEAARDEYWRLIAVHAELQWELGGKGGVEEGDFRSEPASGGGLELNAGTQRWTPGLAWAAIAAALLMSASLAGWALQQTGRSGESVAVASSQPIGDIAPLVDASSWSFGRPGASNSTAVFEGDTLWLDKGALELRLTTNTVALLEAPAIVQTVSTDRFRVIRGSIKVEVAKGAEGFSVETSSAEVIDLGTVFSVSVNGDATDLVVFDGEVDLKVASGALDVDEPAKRFHAGEAVQVRENGTLSRIVQVKQSQVAAGDTQAETAPLITAVRDDNVRDDFWRFYEIVPGGMREDATAFVDRPHEWNGADHVGMPAYLLGGDYVKTFNDDKVTRDLKIEVNLDRAATLYVLLDTRVTPPDWLLESFEETGDLIGVDEVHYAFDPMRTPKPNELAVGPGRSINRRHTVWKRVVDEPGVVQLGANGDLIDDSLSGIEAFANMYGVVAVPLQPE